MKAYEVIRCQGHPNIRGIHPTTFEVTTDKDLTYQGDCIIGVEANKGAADLDPIFSNLLRNDSALLLTSLKAGSMEIRVSSMGDPRLILTHHSDLVWRRSRFIDSRTVGIASDLAAVDLPRELIDLLKDGAELLVEMTVIIRE